MVSIVGLSPVINLHGHFGILHPHLYGQDFFQHKYTLKPWSVSEIRNEMFNVITENKLSLNFSQLTALNNPQALHRAEMAFGDYLQIPLKGTFNIPPAFKQCATRTTIETEVGIRMFSLRQADILNQLDDGSGFVLACVLMHNRCTLEEICILYR